jgi:hypothetical protein
MLKLDFTSAPAYPFSLGWMSELRCNALNEEFTMPRKHFLSLSVSPAFIYNHFDLYMAR